MGEILADGSTLEAQSARSIGTHQADAIFNFLHHPLTSFVPQNANEHSTVSTFTF
jgi:hypothetical protein